MGFFKKMLNSRYLVSDRDEAMTVLEMADDLEQQGNWQKAEAFRLSVPPDYRKEFEARKRKYD